MDFICLTRSHKQNKILSRKEIDGKTSKQIIELCKENENSSDENSYLYYTSPQFSEWIPNDKQPLALYPNLCLNKRPANYEHPHHYLSVHNDNSFFYLFVNIKASNYAVVPPFKVKFDYKNYKTGKDIFDHIDSSFDLEHTNGSTTSFSLSDSAETIFQKAHSQNIEFHCTFTDKAIKLMDHRSRILVEIRSTEKTYIADLITINQYWEPKLQSTNFLTNNESEQIFRDIPGILNCHTMFFQSLEERKTIYASQVCDVFLSFSEFFKVSMPFITKYDSTMKIISKKLSHKNDPKILLHETTKRNLASYLITPIQRMPRYMLFLRELIKTTPNSHPDHHYLHCSLEKIQAITSKLDEATQKAEEKNQIWLIQQKITKQYNLLEASRKLKITANVTCSKEPCHFYLFSDIVLLTRIDRKGETVIYHSKIIDFNYYPAVTLLSFYLKKRLKVVLFENANDFNLFVSTLECIRTSEYEKNGDLLPTFLWTNSSFVKPLPRLTDIAGIVLHDQYIFYGDSTLVVANLENHQVKFIESPISKRTGFSLVGLNDKLYIFGGHGHGNEYFNDTWQYDILSEQWTKLVIFNSPSPRCEHSAIAYNNKIYLFGGRYKKKYYNNLYVLDLEKDVYEEILINELPQPRSLHSAVLYKDQMIIYGGKSNKAVLNDIYSLDLKKHQWKALYVNISLIPFRYGHRSVMIDDMIITLGGTENGETCAKPLIIKCNNDYQVLQYESRGNYPHVLNCFGLCQEINTNMLVVYIENAIFVVQLPSGIEEELARIQKEAAQSIKFEFGNLPAQTRKGITYEDIISKAKNRKTIHLYGGVAKPNQEWLRKVCNLKVEFTPEQLEKIEGAVAFVPQTGDESMLDNSSNDIYCCAEEKEENANHFVSERSFVAEPSPQDKTIANNRNILPVANTMKSLAPQSTQNPTQSLTTVQTPTKSLTPNPVPKSQKPEAESPLQTASTASIKTDGQASKKPITQQTTKSPSGSFSSNNISSTDNSPNKTINQSNTSSPSTTNSISKPSTSISSKAAIFQSAQTVKNEPPSNSQNSISPSSSQKPLLPPKPVLKESPSTTIPRPSPISSKGKLPANNVATSQPQKSYQQAIINTQNKATPQKEQQTMQTINSSSSSVRSQSTRPVASNQTQRAQTNIQNLKTQNQTHVTNSIHPNQQQTTKQTQPNTKLIPQNTKSIPPNTKSIQQTAKHEQQNQNKPDQNKSKNCQTANNKASPLNTQAPMNKNIQTKQGNTPYSQISRSLGFDPFEMTTKTVNMKSSKQSGNAALNKAQPTSQSSSQVKNPPPRQSPNQKKYSNLKKAQDLAFSFIPGFGQRIAPNPTQTQTTQQKAQPTNATSSQRQTNIFSNSQSKSKFSATQPSSTTTNKFSQSNEQKWSQMAQQSRLKQKLDTPPPKWEDQPHGTIHQPMTHYSPMKTRHQAQHRNDVTSNNSRLGQNNQESPRRTLNRTQINK
ncbi:hypothetical protein TRFO_23204 [Tritrichomonas foetus]|uniref:DH domain-containing protein n=1 Tax=Tritrichomonas foetus TaxID=1144522 RepID=A0A1J4KF27_9EUKA|nr:hypothetical protein TRFO_23204 [Tritrichomonas foetus]|eukprot:OHT08364.1 hypothetical protein TRFO_23204 [Tritrichomonas foetus]